MAEFKPISESELISKTVTQKAQFKAISVRFEAHTKVLVIGLSNGVTVEFPTALMPELAMATAQDLSRIEIEGQGYGLYVPALDADIALGPLFKDYLASDLMLKKTRRLKASRLNGQKGGRPTKAA